MVATTFDTHRIIKRLTEAGLSEKTAETVTDVLRETREGDLSQLVTKEHLDQRLALLNQRIENLEQRLIIKLGGMMVIAVGVMATLVKLL